MDFFWHIILSLCVRIFIIFISQFYDNSTGLRYTDIDYGVFTNAAHHMLEGHSPYIRPTYRYSPLIAALLIPNILLHKCWGKFLFSVFDLAISIVIRKIVSKSSYPGLNVCAFMWLYNPLSIIISTRGNADSISCLLVLITLHAHINNRYILSSIFFALSVHVRVYPIIYSLVFYLSIDNDKTYPSIVKAIWCRLLPTRKKIIFVLTFILSITIITILCYHLYGQQFLYESYLYHAYRVDTRHNFSVYFYFNYLLSSFDETLIIYNVLTKLPQLILFVVISFKYSQTKDLPFCLFCLTFIMVVFNTVVTSQYFVWIVSLLPMCYPFIDMTFIEIINVILIWTVPQIIWLWLAYCLEFLGINTFQLIWIESLMFFVANIKVLSITIDYYNYNELKKKNL